jgi:hypothetical protein
MTVSAQRKVDDWIRAKAKRRDDRIRSEVKAFNKVMEALLGLPDEARPRVLRFLYDKYVLHG